MHEMGITQGILAASFDAAEEANCTRITEIRVSVGEMTEVVDFALQFAFEALTPGTMAEGATLVITSVAARSKCLECGIEYEHDRFQMVCPECSAMSVELLQGRELLIDSIECDDGADGPAADDTDDAVSAADPASLADPTGDVVTAPTIAEE
jgi:hydrogenase nickel incorporation protein HypA/HybF